MRVTMLGSGGSAGVPFIGCDCNVCQSDNPKNKRTRVSIFIEINGVNLLVDTSPDLRQQALRNNIRKVDAILYTHAHADHANGIDDVRSFNYQKGGPMPIYGDKATMDTLSHRFSYAFQVAPDNHWYRPTLIPNALPTAASHDFEVEGIPVRAIEQGHGKGKSLGFRIGNFAYSTDADFLSDEAFEALAGVETWIVDCLRYTPAPTHAVMETTLRWVERLKPKRAILTHMSHEMDYDKLTRELPSGIVPGYDGLVFEL